jgi:hypothetical protein
LVEGNSQPEAAGWHGILVLGNSVSEEKIEKQMKGMAATLASILNEEAKDYINMWVFVLAPVFFLLALVGFANLIMNIGKPDEKCWEVQEVKEELVRINACTGEVQSIERPSTK